MKTNLESILEWATPEALVQANDPINLAHRSEFIGRNSQGLAGVRSFLIDDKLTIELIDEVSVDRLK